MYYYKLREFHEQFQVILGKMAEEFVNRYVPEVEHGQGYTIIIPQREPDRRA